MKIERSHNRGWAWWLIAAGLIVLVFLASQVFSAPFSSSKFDPMLNKKGSLPVETNWSGDADITLISKVTLNLTGTTVTTVTADGTKLNNKNASLRVELLDVSDVVISTACVALTRNATTFSNVVNGADVSYYDVAKVRALGVAAC